jgi:hypothetical protein
MGADWSVQEVEATVADYFEMLTAELRGEHFDKSQHRRQLLTLLAGRTPGAVEFKHQNISAALIRLGFPYIEGYKPRWNYQGILFGIVSDRLTGNRTLLEQAHSESEAPVSPVAFGNLLDAEVPPPERKPERGVVREQSPSYPRPPINYPERESRNRALGEAGEIFVIAIEQARLRSWGLMKLADRVEHVSRVKGDGLGYDIRSFEKSGEERLIEVKTTRHGREMPFYVTQNELRVSEIESTRYELHRVFAYRENEVPRFFALRGSLAKTCRLTPQTFVASVA